MKLRYWLLLALVAGTGVAACSGIGETRVVVAAGTTLVDSGFIEELVTAYEATDPDIHISVVALSSAEAVAFAAAGNADMIITHNRPLLDDYLREHPGSLRVDVFASTFFLVADPALSLPSGSLTAALEFVAAEEIPFVSRDDGSGTNNAELGAWVAAGIDPRDEPWYIRTGTGMGATLLVTDQRHAVTLSEHGSFLAARQHLTLVAIPGTDLPNPYDLTVIDPTASPGALAFAHWLLSPDGR